MNIPDGKPTTEQINMPSPGAAEAFNHAVCVALRRSMPELDAILVGSSGAGSFGSSMMLSVIKSDDGRAFVAISMCLTPNVVEAP